MSRAHKTGKKNRTKYIYYTSQGRKIFIVPGEDGVAEADIEFLHSIDDDEVDRQRQYNYYVTTYLDAYHHGEKEAAEDCSKYLNDDREIPEDVLITKENEQQHQSSLKKLDEAIGSLLPQQKELFKKVYVDRRTNTDIAAEEGVTEAAIRNRLEKMYKQLRKYFF